MDTLKIKAFSIGAPLMMHSDKAANPLSVYAEAMKEKTGKRNKTPADFKELSRMEWESALHLHDGVVCIPQEVIFSCLWAGARKNKNGVEFKSGTTINETHCPLSYKGPRITYSHNGVFPNPELDKFFEPHHDQRMEKVQRSKVLRTRAIFHDWSFEFSIDYDDSIIKKNDILLALEKAGKLCGLLERRPQYGKFDFEVIE